MKKGNLEKWGDIPHCTILLLFSQLINELLQKDLFRLVKAMLTELMNMGYLLRYVYEGE